MMATGKAGTCTIVNTADSTAAPQEITVKGKKFLMKGSDFGNVSQPETQTVTPTVKKMGYMLNDGEYIYFWQDQATSGMKMKVVPSVTPVQTTGQPDQPDQDKTGTGDDRQNPVAQLESDAKYRIDCNLGNVNDEVLVPPAQIKFVDLNQAMTFPGADKVPAISLPAGKIPANAKMPKIPDVPTDQPADLNDSGQ
jgi:hypothetical protein